LRGALADFARALVGDLLVKAALIIFLSALVRLVNGHGDELRLLLTRKVALSSLTDSIA
jgi:hypothetical protein